MKYVKLFEGFLNESENFSASDVADVKKAITAGVDAFKLNIVGEDNLDKIAKAVLSSAKEEKGYHESLMPIQDILNVGGDYAGIYFSGKEEIEENWDFTDYEDKLKILIDYTIAEIIDCTPYEGDEE